MSLLSWWELEKELSFRILRGGSASSPATRSSLRCLAFPFLEVHVRSGWPVNPCINTMLFEISKSYGVSRNQKKLTRETAHSVQRGLLAQSQEQARANSPPARSSHRIKPKESRLFVPSRASAEARCLSNEYLNGLWISGRTKDGRKHKKRKGNNRVTMDCPASTQPR